PRFAGERIQTLAEALAFIDRRAVALVELKPDAHNGEALRAATLGEIRRHGYEDAVVLASLSPELIRAARAAAPEARLALFANAALSCSARRADFEMLALNHLRIPTAAVADA